jgi:hypothetical protein
MMRFGVVISVAAFLLALGANAYADVTISTETTLANGAPSARVLYLTAGEVKVDTPKTAIIFELGAGKITTVMKEKKEYMELDLKALGDRMADAAALMKQKMDAVPEAQRKMIEAMMAQHAPGMSAPKTKTSYEKAGDSKTIGAWPCQVFHTRKDGRLVADLCIAPVDAVGVTPADLASFRALAQAMAKSLPNAIRNNASFMDFDDQTKQVGFAGIPVETIVYAGGNAVSTTTVKSVDHAAIAPDAFAIPAGFTKKKMPAFLGGL